MTRRFLASLFCLPLLSQAPAPAPSRHSGRERVGLALAGGSALGLAHVGVIQWLEENHIPIDYIAGTSMGGLIAGMYASGHDSASMREFVGTLDWNLALSSAPSFQSSAFRRKEDLIEYPAAIEVGLKKGKVSLPPGLSAGHGVGLVISRFASPYSEMKSFDELPTPFRCVATDLVTASGVVFDRGSLFEALRATMSLPAFFAPVEAGNRLLVDGGLVNNLPVDVVRKMGADIVIAVALDVPPDPQKYTSLLGVAGRSISLMITQNERQALAHADLIVMPDLKGLAATDFSKHEELRKVGYAAAEHKSRTLKMLSVGSEAWDTYSKARQAKRRAVPTRIDQVEIVGDLAPRRKQSLVAALQSGGGKVEQGALESELTKVTGMGRFDTASYEFTEKDGKESLRVRVHEKTHGPPFIRPSILIDGYNGGGMKFGVGARFTALDFGGPASELRIDGSIGAFNRLAGEYYWRISGGKWFVAPRGEYDRFDFPFYDQGKRVAEFTQRQWDVAADLGYAFGRFQEARIGYLLGHLQKAQSTGPATGQELDGRVAAVETLWRYDKTDAPNIPRRGVRGSFRANWYSDYPGVARQFPAFEAKLAAAHILSPKWSTILRASGGTTVNEPALYNYFAQGGLYQMSALERQQMIGNNYYLGSAYLLRSLSAGSGPFSGRFYGAIGYEAGRAWYPGLTAKPRSDGVLGLVGETVFGVVFLGGSIGDQGDRKILFRVGRIF